MSVPPVEFTSKTPGFLSRLGKGKWFAGLVVLFFCWMVLGSWSGQAQPHSGDREAGAKDEASRPSSNAKKFPVSIRRPAGPPRVVTGVKDRHGNEITVGCSTCHANRAPNFENRMAGDLNEFHQGIKLNHGNISCLSCHHPDDYDSLKLADGAKVAYVNVMELCGQCHGPQTRDYLHGAHGGMQGYWDLTRGPRNRNNCIDCHDPHLPQFPRMQPTFKPQDRFLNRDGH